MNCDGFVSPDLNAFDYALDIVTIEGGGGSSEAITWKVMREVVPMKLNRCTHGIADYRPEGILVPLRGLMIRFK